MFLLEKYLDALPTDWHDCITFIFTNGMDQREGHHVVIMDDEETERFMKVYEKLEAPIFIISEKLIDGKKYIWNVALARSVREDGKKDKDPEKVLIGGEEFRKYCDERNLYYRSFLTSEGLLISSSNLMYQKTEGEDCRIPHNDS
jgi:hypothetical protein